MSELRRRLPPAWIVRPSALWTGRFDRWTGDVDGDVRVGLRRFGQHVAQSAARQQAADRGAVAAPAGGLRIVDHDGAEVA